MGYGPIRLVVVALFVSFAVLVLLSYGEVSSDDAEGATINVGPGETYSSIQPAVDAAGFGDTISIKDGTYEENVVVDKPVEIIGTTVDGTVIKGNLTGSVLTINASGVNISRLSVFGASRHMAFGGIHILGGSNCTISSVWAYNAGGCGLIIGSGCNNITVMGCEFGYNRYYGIHIKDLSGGHTILNNNCSNNQYTGILLGNCNNTLVSSNKCKWNVLLGITVNGKNNTLSTNNCSYNRAWGLSLYGENNSATSNDCHENGVGGLGIGGLKNVARRNRVYANGEVGIRVSGSGVLVVENTVRDHNNAPPLHRWIGISLYRTDSNTTCQGNTIVNCDAGITIGYSVDTIIRGNIVRRSTGSAISIDWDCTRILVQGNTCSHQSMGIKVYSDNCTVDRNVVTDCEYNGLYIDGHWSSSRTDNTVITNNTIHHCDRDGMSVRSKNTTVANNTVHSCEENGIRIHREDNIVEDNLLYNNKRDGISVGKDQQTSFKRPWNVVVRNNRAHNNTYNGISISTTETLVVVGNTCIDNEYAGLMVWSYGGVIRNNSCRFNKYIGLRAGSSGSLVVENNTCTDNIYGTGLTVTLYEDAVAFVWNNVLSRNGVGLSIGGDSPMSKFEDNAISANTLGLSIGSSCTNITVSNNYITGNTEGVKLTACSNVSLLNNTIKESSEYNIMVTKSSTPSAPLCHDNEIRGNLILDGGRHNVGLYHCTNITLTGNRIKGGLTGLYMLDTIDCLIYDNWFQNAHNWNGERNVGTIWNVTKRSGVNICGFDFQGGNYWSNYFGMDFDGDWIGDSLVPHSPGDHLPLLRETVPPTITDNTTGTPTTGDSFTFRVDASDNQRIWGVWLNYKYDSGEWINVSMVRWAGIAYFYQVDVPSDQTGNIRYFVTIMDYSENRNDTVERTLNVVDNDRPEILGYEIPEEATTGDPTWLKVNATDNVALTRVWVEYWWGSSTHINKTMDKYITPQWVVQLPAPDTVDIVYCIFHVTDAGRNLDHSGPFEIRMLDNDAPIVVSDLSPKQAFTGDLYTISVVIEENVELANVTIEIQFGQGDFTNITMRPTGSDIWSSDVMVPIDSLEPLMYSVLAVDTSNLSTKGPKWSVQVLDGKTPEIVSDRTASVVVAGRPITFKVSITDNIAVAEAWVICWNEDGESYTFFLNQGSEDLWTIDVDTPWVQGDISYQFHARDEQNNTVDGAIGDITILDQGPPWFMSDDSPHHAGTGDEVRLSIEVWDSNGIDQVRALYRFGNNEPNNVSMNYVSGDEWTMAITVPEDSTESLFYSFFAMDMSGNVNWTDVREVFVFDDVAPLIRPSSHPREVETGTEYGFSARIYDNIQIREAWVIVTVPFEGMRNLSMENIDGPTWFVSDTFDRFVKCTSVFWAIDIQGNINSSKGPEFIVVDVTAPIIGYVSVDPNPQKVGSEVTLIVEILDASLVTNVFVLLENPDGRITNVSMDIAENDTWRMVATYSKKGIYQFKIIARDDNNLWTESDVQSFKIIDEDGLDGTSSDDEGGLGFTTLLVIVIMLIIIAIVAVVVIMRMRNRTEYQ